MKYVIANWKAHKNVTEGKQWLSDFTNLVQNDPKVLNKLESGIVKIVICPPFPLLFLLKENIPLIANIHLGAQDISKNEVGSFTGEVCAESLEGLVDYVIIGHSERRTLFGESNDDVEKKITQARKYNITPILCIRGTQDTIYSDAKIVAYEPSEYIGTGKSQALEEILKMKRQLKIDEGKVFLYGAGVTEKSVKEFLARDEIDGLLVGSASLDPKSFYAIVSCI